jgi:hypothetical protein
MDRWRRRRNDDVNGETNQVRCEVGELISLPGPAVLKDDVLSLNIAELVQTLPEYLKERRVGGRGAEQQKTYPGSCRRQLCSGDEWCHEEAEGEGDEEPESMVHHRGVLQQGRQAHQPEGSSA